MVINRIVAFYNRSIRYSEHFEFIDECTLELQCKGATQSDCRVALLNIIGTVNQLRIDSNSCL